VQGEEGDAEPAFSRYFASDPAGVLSHNAMLRAEALLSAKNTVRSLPSAQRIAARNALLVAIRPLLSPA
jgi:hypothetical protein